MRPSRALVTTFVALAFATSSCGGDDADRDPAGYLPADAGAAAVLSTDIDSDQWQALEEWLLAGPLAPENAAEFLGDGEIPPPTTLEGYLRQATAFSGLSYDDDVEPLLGGDLVAGVDRTEVLLGDSEAEEEGTLVAALDTGDEAGLREILERLRLTEQGEFEGASIYADESRFTQFAVDGDTLVFAERETSFDSTEEPPVPSQALADAISLERSGEGLTTDAFDRSGVADDALVRLHGDLSALLASAEDLELPEIPWLEALESFDATLSFDEEELSGEAVVRTNPAGLTPEDLPVAADVETPEVVVREGEIAGASADQSQTTTFLLDTVREAFPDSNFVRDVARVERALDIDFERDFLAQFNGPSVSSLPLTEDFAARSTVADPKRMATLLRRLAPDVGRLVQDLQGLQGRGLIPLFLFAPDAPISPGVLGESRIDVSRVPGERDLYLISELIPGRLAPVTPLPEEIVFGLVDDVFVVASDLERARDIARADAEPAPEGVEGASITVGDLAPLRDEIEQAVGADLGPLGEMTASLSADTSALRGRFRVSRP